MKEYSLEARLKFDASKLVKGRYDWWPLEKYVKWENFNFEDYDIRVNKTKQYHRADTPGCKEDYEEAMVWLRLKNGS